MGNGMLGALAMRGRPHIDGAHKESMRSLILDRTAWTSVERQNILDYCESDVDGLVALLEPMASPIDWPRALLRGRYMSAVARMERNGVPVDRTLYRTFVEQWPEIRGRLVEEVDRDYGVYDDVSFRMSRFEALLKTNGMSWPRLPSGALDLKDDTFKEQCRLYPRLSPLHELRQSLSKRNVKPPSWTWRAYVFVITICVGAAAFLTWLVSVVKNVDYLTGAREKVGAIIGPTPVSLTLRDVRLLEYEAERTLPTGDADIAKVEIVGEKKGDSKLRDCKGELGYSNAAWKFRPIVFEAPLSYTYPKGPNELVMTYSFDMGIAGGYIRLQGQPPIQTKLQFRVICEGIVSKPFELIGTER